MSENSAKTIRNRGFQRRRRDLERIRRRLQLLREVADLALDELRSERERSR